MKNSGIPLSSFPKHVQDQISAQLHKQKPTDERRQAQWNAPITTFGKPRADKGAGVFSGGSHPTGAIHLGDNGAKRIRQSSKGPNKTEAAFAAHIRACYPGAAIYEQQVTLVLANGLRYTPDIFFPGSGARPAFYEVKGFARDDAVAKLKMAPTCHRWADFFLVTKRGRTCIGWDIQVVLPLP